MIIHTVKSPFTCRMGQFEANKKSLCIGLDINTVMSNDIFRCYLGKNKKVYYEIESQKALKLVEEYNSYWINSKGKKVAILPIKDFTRYESKWNEEKYEKKEIKRGKIKEKIKAEMPTLF